MENAIILNTGQFFEIISRLERIEKLQRDTAQKKAKEILTFKEVQQLLKCSRNTVNSYIEKGYFKSYQTGGKYSKILFKRSEIEYFLESK